MLIGFAVENFMSFRDSVKFSMVAGKIVRHGDHVICQNNKRILKSSFLFGANASGKSNLVSAVAFAKKLVINGLKNTNCEKKYFRIDPEYKTKPGVFQFEIMANNRFYSYGFAISYVTATIEEEWLYRAEDEICIFLRHKTDDGITVIDSEVEFTGERFKIYSEDIRNPKMNQTLFLSDVVMRSPDDEEYQPFNDVMSWFKDLTIIFPTSRFMGISAYFEDENRQVELARLLNYFDTGIAHIYKKETDLEKVLDGLPEKYIENVKSSIVQKVRESDRKNFRVRFIAPNNSLIEVEYKNGNLCASRIHTDHGNKDDLFEIADESDGTRRLFDLIPIYQMALMNKVILVDELDRSLHSKLLQEFIRYFYDVTYNMTTQLIATTQDSYIMDLNFLRQDEIWFLERQPDQSSKIYSLSSFKERFDKKVEKDYLLGRYGGIPVFSQFSLMEENTGEP